MKNIHHICFFALIALISVVILQAPDAISEDNTCSIGTQFPELFINVYDVHPNGKPGIIIWQGRLKQNQQVQIKANYGRFYYNYSADPTLQTAMISGIVLFCKDGEVINIP